VAAANPTGMEKMVALTFLLALVGFAGFGAAFWVNASNFWLGMTLGVGFLGLGVGMVAWGKYLMPRGPFSESRHSMVPTQAEKARIAVDFSSRGKVVIERRTFLAKVLGAATAVFSVVVMFPLIRSLGPVPKDFSLATAWHPHSLLVNVNGGPVHVDSLEYGGMLTVFPEGDVGGALSQTMLIRQQPPAGETRIVTRAGRETWGPLGYLAFSKVCRLPDRPLPAGDASVVVPVPPVALRRRAGPGSSAGLRSRSTTASPATALRRHPWVPAGAAAI
jgi:ubiquinol-cytochrome c reductase iron-sulfur subunit